MSTPPGCGSAKAGDSSQLTTQSSRTPFFLNFYTPLRRTFGAFSHICMLTCRGDVTYSIENLPSRGRAHGRDTRVHRAPWSSPPASSPHHTASEFRIVFEPTHGKTTKIALQATPGVLRLYRITSSRSLLSHHQLPSTAVCRTPGRGAPEEVGLLRRHSRPQSCRCTTPGASEGTWLSRCPSRQPARRPLLSQETSLRAAP